MNNERGVVVVVVLATTLIIMILGAAAIKMSELGYLAYGSEKRYEIANMAAEYGVSSGIKYAVDNNACPSTTDCSGTVSTGGVTATYSCFAFSAGNKCFINGTGTFGGAKVVKNVIVPQGGGSPGDYGALTMRNGGTIQMGGSAAIVSCVDSCERPGLMYGGSTTLQAGGGLNNTDVCPNNPKGIYGSPYAVVNKDGNPCSVSHSSISCPSTTAMSDLVPKVFNSADWAGLKTDLGGIYNGHSVDVSSLSVSGMATAPAVPSPTCICNNSSFTLDKTVTSCSGVASFGDCGGQVKFNGTLTINSIPSNVSTIVVTNNIDISGVLAADGNFQGKSIYASGTGRTITINDGDVSLNGTTISAGGGITLQSVGQITNGSVISAGGDITMESVASINDPAHSEYSTVSLVAGGNITLQSSSGITKADIVATGTSANITIQGSSGISNSTLVTAGTSGDITIQGGYLNSSTLVTKDSFTIQGTNGVTNSNIFANTMTIQQFNSDIAGGILYTQGNMVTQGAGNSQVGATSNPTLLLIGGSLTMQHTGTPDFNGLIFANGTITYQSSGDLKVNGAIIGNSTSANVIQPSGNAQISFNPTLLDALSTALGGKMKSVNCSGGGGNRQPYITSTKITVY